MDVSRNLKNTNPQIYYIKIICNVMYYLGFGSCWYEPREKTVFQSRLYLAWATLSNFYTIAGFFNEFLANCRRDLNAQEQNDVIQYTLAHSTILAKIMLNYYYNKDIKKVLERLLKNKSTFASLEMEKACVKRFLTLCSVFIGTSYFTLTACTAEGIKAYFTEGIPIRTEVVYYPSSSDSGLLVNIIRFFVVFHWFYAVAIMIIIDCVCICALVISGYKFKMTQVYFESLRKKILEEKRSRVELEEQYRKDFVAGIVMHEDALWCAKNVQSALGNLYSVQVIESVVLIVMCLLKLVRVERNLVFLLANFAYMFCLIVITGGYMMAGGDITHEASEVSKSIFYSGWDLVGAGRPVRTLAVIALQRSQVPVYMCAFGIMTLSYNNFITVIRSSYSFFAVMY